MIKIALYIYLSLTLIGSVALYVAFNYQMALSYVASCLIMQLNIVALAWIWRIIFQKKSIALAVGLIIFKYSILAAILWKLSSVKWLEPVGFVLGLLIFMVALIGSLFFKNKLQTDKS